MPSRKEWYFVYKFPSDDPRQIDTPYEVQVLDDKGRAQSFGYFDEHCTRLTVHGVNIPPPVFAAAMRMPEGSGDYVDSNGALLDPFPGAGIPERRDLPPGA
jgi:hypothetical protein